MRIRITMDFHSNVVGMILGTKKPQSDFIMAFTAPVDDVITYFNDLVIIPLHEKAPKEFSEALNSKLEEITKSVNDLKSSSFRLVDGDAEVVFKVDVLVVCS